MQTKQRAKRNRTITMTDNEREAFRQQLVRIPVAADTDLINKIICADMFAAIRFIPRKSVDLLFIDPPYNLNKKFHNHSFSKMNLGEYAQWLDSWFKLILPVLKPEASVYVCGDWRNSAAIYEVLSNYLYVRSRITWEREKGRGSLKNWKNSSEDIWFATVSKDYYFNVEAVKLKRRVMAPYRHADGQPKDWNEDPEGNSRLTHPSNLWTDLTVPFWSMTENTDHPTQKPEKLAAKVILASSRPHDVIFDPFLGSGTTAVVAKKLGRSFYGIEIEEEYCCLAWKRLQMAEQDSSIQGYTEGVFWERNSLGRQKKKPFKVHR